MLSTVCLIMWHRRPPVLLATVCSSSHRQPVGVLSSCLLLATIARPMMLVSVLLSALCAHCSSSAQVSGIVSFPFSHLCLCVLLLFPLAICPFHLCYDVITGLALYRFNVCMSCSSLAFIISPYAWQGSRWHQRYAKFEVLPCHTMRVCGIPLWHLVTCHFPK